VSEENTPKAGVKFPNINPTIKVSMLGTDAKDPKSPASTKSKPGKNAFSESENLKIPVLDPETPVNAPQNPSMTDAILSKISPCHGKEERHGKEEQKIN